MRPLRLLLEGFGSYRHATDIDLSDVDFFVLIGPTGSGKSTVIDGICFALYGTVPRWGKGNMVSLALAPSETACRVCLVFEAYGGRYAAVRVLTRSARGQVQTKEARLDRLDDAIPSDAPLIDLLAASVEQVAEGSDVTPQVEKLLGLTYGHFTQCVMLPQGKFAEFLQARPADRQDLLVQLLAYGVYAEIGQKARSRATLTGQKIDILQSQRDELAGATEDAENAALDKVSEISQLAANVDEDLEKFAENQKAALLASTRAEAGRDAIERLGRVTMPADVPTLGERIDDADLRYTQAESNYNAEQKTADLAASVRDELGDEHAYREWSRCYSEQRAASTTLADRQRGEAEELANLKQAEEPARNSVVRTDQAENDLENARFMNSAAAIAANLHIGDPCPVCGQEITDQLHHDTADLKDAERDVADAKRAQQRATAALNDAASAAATASAQAASERDRLDALTRQLADAPPEAKVVEAVANIQTATKAAALAEAAARAGREELASAAEARRLLDDDERASRQLLSATRDTVVDLGAPLQSDDTVFADWSTLVQWGQTECEGRTRDQTQIDAEEARAREAVAAVLQALNAALTEHGLQSSPDSSRARAVVASAMTLAESTLTEVRTERAKAQTLDDRLSQLREERDVASMLGALLQAGKFERWLCGEALDTLVAHASDTLMGLSGGQYELDRNERNELVVIDYNDAGTRRPVHTLSGGETFQASLALALALSQQVVELSAGRRALDSMFLDEGFGTLDDTTLDTVASTLEALASEDDRMVGVITHVPALADRIPVRLVVNRDSNGSHVSKERV